MMSGRVVTALVRSCNILHVQGLISAPVLTNSFWTADQPVGTSESHLNPGFFSITLDNFTDILIALYC